MKTYLSVCSLLFQEKSKVVYVHGDTLTTLVGGLAARSMRKKLVHIEAGYCGPPNGGQSVHSSSFPCKMIHPSVIPRMKQQGAFTCNRVHGM
jgi:hypothetical protein